MKGRRAFFWWPCVFASETFCACSYAVYDNHQQVCSSVANREHTWWIRHDRVEQFSTPPWILSHVERAQVHDAICDAILSGRTDDPWLFCYRLCEIDELALLAICTYLSLSSADRRYPSHRSTRQSEQLSEKTQLSIRIRSRPNRDVTHVCHAPRPSEWVVYKLSWCCLKTDIDSMLTWELYKTY